MHDLSRFILVADLLFVAGCAHVMQRYAGQHMGLLCVARSVPNQLQMLVFNVQMKWMTVYMVSVGPNQAEYAARFIKTNVECLILFKYA